MILSVNRGYKVCLNFLVLDCFATIYYLAVFLKLKTKGHFFFFFKYFAVVFRSCLLISRSLVVGLLASVIMLITEITQTPWEMPSFLSKSVQ